MIGSPSVFQTAPPQPASNARITCSPLFAGGADASQNGFGLLMPAKSMLRSAMIPSPSLEQESRSVPSVGDRVDHFVASVDAASAGEHLGVPGLAVLGIRDDATLRVELDAAELLRDLAELRLADRDRDHVT